MPAKRPSKSERPASRPKKKTVATLKTQPKEASVDSFLNAIPHEGRRKDAFTVLAMMRKATKAEPKMWGGAIVGFGQRNYTYESGRSLDFFLMGFSPRKAALTLYFMSGLQTHAALLKSLGKHKTGKGCLYIQSLEDIDERTLASLMKDSLANLATRGGVTSGR